MMVFENKIRVRYGETDQMGYMYYGNYAQFYEVARVEMLRSMGLSYKEFEKNGIMMPVLELKCKYIKPIFYDEEVTIKTSLLEMPGTRIHFKYELYNEKNDLCNIGETTLVFVDMNTKRPCLGPQDFLEKLKTFFQL